MEYHPVTKQITELLMRNGCWYETFEHEAVRTSEEAAAIRTGYSLQQGAKALIVRVKKIGSENHFAMLVFPANLKFNKQKVQVLFAVKDLRFATEEEVSNMTGGVQAGGVPPFGNLFGLKVIADPKLFENERIIFNAGDRRFSVAMKSEDYARLVQPRVESVT